MAWPEARQATSGRTAAKQRSGTKPEPCGKHPVHGHVVKDILV